MRTENLLRRRLEVAIDEGIVHIELYEQFTSNIENQAPGQTEEWRRMILEWESGDMEEGSPYDIEGEGMSSV